MKLHVMSVRLVIVLAWFWFVPFPRYKMPSFFSSVKEFENKSFQVKNSDKNRPLSTKEVGWNGRGAGASSPTGIFLRVGNVADNFSSEVNMAIRWVCVYLLCLATCQLCISSSQFSPNSGE